MLHYHTLAHPHVIFMLTAGASDGKHIAAFVHINVTRLYFTWLRDCSSFPLQRVFFFPDFSLALRFAGNVQEIPA